VTLLASHSATGSSRDAAIAPLVSVCICTFRRPQVAKAVLSIFEQQDLENAPFEVLVCDDDPNASAAPLFERLCAAAPLLRYVISGAGNVAIARNTCLAAARGALIAFIDDDQVADPRWLSTLLRAQAAHCAHVVKGRVRGIYPPDTPEWVKAADPFTRDYGPTGSRLSEGGTGNVLFVRDLYAHHGLVFDPAFGIGGGEDSNFFRRATALGAVMISCREAVVDEIVPPYRVGRPYLVDKALRYGETAGRSSRLGDVERGRALDEFARALAGVSLGWIYPALRPMRNASAYRVMVKFWYSVGVLRGLLGSSVRRMA
jgi:succinoglycan biosynthesis protein ExoM